MSHDHDHDHDHHDHAGHDHHHHHGHDHDHAQGDQNLGGKNPAEQAEIAQHLGEELTALFVRYVGGELDFAELSFSTYDVLQDLHVVALGEYELEYVEDDDSDDDDDAAEDGGTESDYDRESATAQQEDLAQEPSRD